ncbi:MAG TPA: glutathione S-transferase family protein [Rhodanobacteraceae bacterium]|nr:glutathione S-transferase family protein [Rhodanobacteraceae bacterium]
MSRILYSGTRNASSWALRAWLALREAGVEFEEHVVDIRRPQRFANLAKIGEFSPPAAVPVLVDGDTVIFDSLAIMEYANELCGGRLLPADPKRRAHARSLLAWQHSGLSGICAGLSYESAFYPKRRAMTEAEFGEAKRLFDVWENELRASGGPFLAGDLALPDIAFVPAVLRLAAHTDRLAEWPLAHAWSQRLLARPALVEWLAEARTLPPVFQDDYVA